MPLLTVEAICEEREGCECPRCTAMQHLVAEDWSVVEFYRLVRDQVVNVFPMGTSDDVPWLAPRLEGWLAACDLYGVAREVRATLIDVTRYLHDAVIGRVHEYGLFKVDPAELAPPAEA